MTRITVRPDLDAVARHAATSIAGWVAQCLVTRDRAHLAVGSVTSGSLIRTGRKIVERNVDLVRATLVDCIGHPDRGGARAP